MTSSAANSPSWRAPTTPPSGWPAVTGAVTGLLVALFDWVTAQNLLDRLYTWPVAVQAVAPLVGLTLAALALRWLAGGASPSTSDEYVRNFHQPDRRLDLRPVLGRVLASVATLGLGGAMGFEGPSMYMGAAVGTAAQSRFRRMFDSVDTKVLMVAGAAAGVAAIFKTPATGAIFAIEVPFQDDTAKRMLFPALIASVSGYLVFVAINGTTPLLPISGAPPFGFRELAGAAALGILAGVVARGFTIEIMWAKRWQERLSTPAKVALGGGTLTALVAVSHVVYGQTLTLGSGYRVIAWIVAGHHALWAVALLLVLRAIVTPATVTGGGAGGLFVPLVVLGALLGEVCGQIVHEPTHTLFPVIGVAALLGAGYRTPLAAVVFVAEATGRPGFIVPGVIAAVVSQLMMGRAVGVAVPGDPTAGPPRAPLRPAPDRRHPGRRVERAVGSHADRAGRRAPAGDPSHDGARRRRPSLPRPDRSGRPGLGATRRVGLDAGRRRSFHPTSPAPDASWTIEQAVRVMDGSDRDVLGVVDADGQFVGLVTTADLVRLDEILGRSEGR